MHILMLSIYAKSIHEYHKFYFYLLKGQFWLTNQKQNRYCNFLYNLVTINDMSDDGFS